MRATEGGRERPEAGACRSRGAVLVATALLAACAESTGRTVSFLHYRAVVPDRWEALDAESSMRLAEFEAGGGAQMVLYYFGPGQGGSAEANIDRWETQFTTPEGDPVTADVGVLEGTSFATTVAELRGSYSRGIGMGAAEGEAVPGQALLAAVVETPDGNLYPQLFGPEAAVDAEREGFVAFLRSIEAGEGPAGSPEVDGG